MNNSISTNGTASTDTYVELAKAGVSWFFISLDYLDAKFFDRWTGSCGKLPDVIANILSLCALRSSENYYRLVINLMLTQKSVLALLDNDATGLRNLLAWCIASGVDDFKFLPASITPLTAIFIDAEARRQFVQICMEVVPKSFNFFHYRLNSLSCGGHGLRGRQHHTCQHFLDDRAFDSIGAYPCIIHLREGGYHLYHHADSQTARLQKIIAFHNTNRVHNAICYRHCFDVYRDFSDRVTSLLD